MSAFFISNIVIFSFANSLNTIFLKSTSLSDSSTYCFVPSSFSLISLIFLISGIFSFIISILFSVSSTVTYVALFVDTFFSRFSGVSIATIFPLFIIIVFTLYSFSEMEN